MRKIISQGLGFSTPDREKNIRRMGEVCHLLTKNGVVAIAVAGLALSVFLFHGIRLLVARGLKGETLRPADLRAHLAMLEPIRETSTDGS